jgi:C4-dicarboxylate-specific signal transduction histidine kinase
VHDSGSGISRREITGLFRRFRASGRETGYGIGLPLALAIARSQNGDIEVDGGSCGAGATFTLKLYRSGD